MKKNINFTNMKEGSISFIKKTSRFIKNIYRNLFFPIEHLKFMSIIITIFLLRLFNSFMINKDLAGDIPFSSTLGFFLSLATIMLLLFLYWFRAKYIVKLSFTFIGHCLISVLLAVRLPVRLSVLLPVRIDDMKLDNISSNVILFVVFIILMLMFKLSLKSFKNEIFSNLIKYKKFNFYTVYYISFFGIILANILLYIFPNLSELFIIVIWGLAIGLTIWLAILFQIPSKTGLKIDFLNLDYKEMFQNRIFIASNVTEHHRVFKFDFAEMLPDNIEIKEVYLKHRLCINPQVDSKGGKSLYYAIDGREKLPINMKSERLKIILKYNEKGKNKTKYAKLNMYINKKIEQNEIIITDYFITQFYEIRLFIDIRNCFQKFLMGIKFDFDNPLQLLKKAYKYNMSFGEKKDEYQINSSYNNAKWLFHNGGYGSGKTTLNYLYTSHVGYYPIHISPWEDNYDHDILYLIYGKVCSLPPFPRKSTIVFFFIILFAIWKFLLDIWKMSSIEALWKFLLDIQKMPPINDFLITVREFFGFQIDKEILTLFMPLIFFVIASIITWLFLSSIIIHFKNSTKVHQEYYLQGIVNEIVRNKKFIIIEDVDRLSVEALDELFRVCASISKASKIKTRGIGLLSFSKENLKDKYKEYSSRKGMDFDFDKHFSDLENKLFHKEVFKDYSSQKSMEIYLEDTIERILHYQNEESKNIKACIRYWKIFKKKIKFRKVRINKNFRDVQKCVGDIIYKMDKDKLDCKSFRTMLDSLVEKKDEVEFNV